MIFNRYLFEVGITKLKDLLKTDESFYSYDEIKHKYGENCKINFLDYYSIVHAVPHEYKAKLKRPVLPRLSCLESVLMSEKVSKYVYNKLLDSRETFPESAFAFYKRTIDSYTI